MEQKKARFSLSRKLALMVAAIALTLSAVQIFSSYTHYRAEMYEHYEEFAMNIAAVAASQLDPDRIQHYLDTGEKDETYETAYKTLCDIRENGGVMYLYVVKPEIDEVWYVMDTDPSEDAIPLGYHEPYYEGAFAENAERMARGERIEPLVSNEQFGWLMSVYYPMKTSTGAPAGYVGVDIQMDDVMKDLQRFARQMILLMAALTLAVSLILIRITSKTMAEPIKKLSSAADKLVHEQSGEGAETSIFNQLTIRSNDEVGALYESLRQMEHDMNAYIRDLVSVTAEKERIGAELNVATQIQADMLPRIFPAFPERGEFDIYASMIPAKEVGGDFYDFFLIDDDHLGLVMADVSGKGVPAALFMVIAKTLIKN
jgi:sigma-B regulation protein RsbU (phosphoserine phosphatase)